MPGSRNVATVFKALNPAFSPFSVRFCLDEAYPLPLPPPGELDGVKNPPIDHDGDPATPKQPGDYEFDWGHNCHSEALGLGGPFTDIGLPAPPDPVAPQPPYGHPSGSVPTVGTGVWIDDEDAERLLDAGGWTFDGICDPYTQDIPEGKIVAVVEIDAEATGIIWNEPGQEPSAEQLNSLDWTHAEIPHSVISTGGGTFRGKDRDAPGYINGDPGKAVGGYIPPTYTAPPPLIRIVVCYCPPSDH